MEPDTTRQRDPDEIRIGVSSCLLGEEVRFDGGHKRDPWVLDSLAAHATFVPVCPEVELGLGTPREPIRLERRGDAVRLVETRGGRDLTEAMTTFAHQRAEHLLGEDLDGFVLKSKSPSCGMERVKIWSGKGGATKDGRGVFADALITSAPLLPVEEEGRLHDPGLRENFVERVFAHRRLRALFSSSWRARDLVRFHSREKLLLLAHEPGAYRELGRLVAEQHDIDHDELAARYPTRYMQALAHQATTGRHVNVLQHMAGYFKDDLDAGDRAELHEVIGAFERRHVPLVVPITLIRHYVRRLGVDYLSGQIYLEPHPAELMLRNHV